MKKEYKDLTVEEKKEYLYLKAVRETSSYSYMVYAILLAFSLSMCIYTDPYRRVALIGCTTLIALGIIYYDNKKYSLKELFKL